MKFVCPGRILKAINLMFKHSGVCLKDWRLRKKIMAHEFKVGDHVEWNSEAGRVSGKIQKIVTSPITFKGYTVHANKDHPQYLIKSDKTDHMAMHKREALTKID